MSIQTLEPGALPTRHIRFSCYELLDSQWPGNTPHLTWSNYPVAGQEQGIIKAVVQVSNDYSIQNHTSYPESLAKTKMFSLLHQYQLI